MRFRKRLAWINVSLQDRVVYLGGNTETAGDTENVDHSATDPLLARGSLLRGSVNFLVTSRCSFRHLRVVLVGTLQTLAISKEKRDQQGLAAQRQNNLRHEVDVLDGRSPHFDKGVHTLAFAVLLPSDLQPSFRCPYGKQEYCVAVWAEEVDGRATTSKTQSLILLSSGEYIDSASPLLDVVTYSGSLGYVSATMHCEVPSVGAQAFFQLDLPAPDPTITLLGVKVSLVQTVEVQTGESAPVIRTHETQIMRLNNAVTWGAMDPVTGKATYVPMWAPGTAISVAQTVKLPTHETFAPTSSIWKPLRDPAGKLRMTVSHHALIKVRFSTPANGIREATITSRDLFLLSCKCLPNSLVLPPYSPQNPVQENADTKGLDWFNISKRKLQGRRENEDCTCFVAADIAQPQLASKPEVPRAMPLKA